MMEAMEALLMDMLDDAPDGAEVLPEGVDLSADPSIARDMQVMLALNPVLAQCAEPVTPSDVARLESVRSAVHASMSKSALITKLLWSGAGLAAGGGLLALALSIGGNESPITATSPAPPTPRVAREVVVEPAPAPSVAPAPQRTRTQIEARADDAELRSERQRRSSIAASARGMDAYQAYRDLYHIDLALGDTVEAAASLRAALRWAEQEGRTQDAERCRTELNELTTR
jgi:hypothetical protein